MKSKYNLFQAILLAFIIPFTFTACDDDDKAVPESQVSWTLSLKWPEIDCTKIS